MERERRTFVMLSRRLRSPALGTTIVAPAYSQSVSTYHTSNGKARFESHTAYYLIHRNPISTYQQHRCDGWDCAVASGHFTSNGMGCQVHLCRSSLTGRLAMLAHTNPHRYHCGLVEPCIRAV